jgi:glycosyltransferase involved in cell wall biosynthesis
MNTIDFSIVVPALNEADSIAELYTEIVDSLDKIGGTWELLFVDDGSDDDTADIMQNISQADSRVTVLGFTRNFGKSAAYSAAFSMARGNTVITMDGDLQDNPAELPVLVEALRQGNDLVVGWKLDRLENEPGKTIPSRVFNALNRILFGMSFKDQNSGYRAMRRVVAQSLELQGDQYRFIPQLAHLAGFKVAEVGVRHRRRKYGNSKYGLSRFWTGLLDLFTVRFLTRFRRRPLHFFGTMALIMGAIGVGLEAYVLASKLFGDTFQQHIAAMIIGVMLILIGFQCLIIGLIGELLAAPPLPQFVLTKHREGASAKVDTGTLEN